MARRPLTWRNVGDSGGFAGAGSLLGLLSDGGSGFREANEDLRKTDKIEDERRTNDAIVQEMLTGRPSTDRRVNQTIAQTARLKRSEDHRLTRNAVSERLLQDTQTELERKNIDVFDERFDSLQSETEAATAESEAQTKLTNLEVRIAGESEDRATRLREQIQTAGSFDDEAIDFAQNRYLERQGVTRDSMTEAHRQGMLKAGTDFIDSPDGDEWIRRRGIELDIDTDVMDTSPHGVRTAENARLVKEAEAARNLVAIQRDEEGHQADKLLEHGSYALIVMGDNGVEAIRKENIAKEKMSTFTDVTELMQNNGIFADKWINNGKKEKAGIKALEAARNRIPNKSLYEAAVLPWLDSDGSLDIPGLNKAMALLGSTNQTQQLEGQELINEQRRKQNPDAPDLKLVELVAAAIAAGGDSAGKVKSVVEQLRAGTAERSTQDEGLREENFDTGTANIPTHEDLLELPRNAERTRLLNLRRLIMEGKKSLIDDPFSADFEDQEKALQEFNIRIGIASAKQQAKNDKAARKDRLRARAAARNGQ